MAQIKGLKSIHELLSSSKAEASPADYLNYCLKKTIEEENKSGRKPSTHYKPSSMNCIRQMYYQRTGADVEELPPNSNLQGIMESGADRHKRIQSYLTRMKKYGHDVEWIDVKEYVKQKGIKNITFKPTDNPYETHCILDLGNGITVSFLTDAILKIRGKYYVFEFKTESLGKYIVRKQIAREHKNQGTSYSVAFLIDDIIYLYENRDNCMKKPFDLHIAEQEKKALVNRLMECERAVKRGQAPEAEENPKVCQYCNYQAKCQQEGKVIYVNKPRKR